jgi:hypothetical protein
MTQDPQWLANQPAEGLPSSQYDKKIEQLEQLRLKIRFAREDYRFAPTVAKEAALRALIQRECDLSAEVGFGASPAPSYGRSKIPPS